jgi:hypothetical protein
MKKTKTVQELGDKELEEYSYIATDSVLLYDALFDEQDEELVALAKEFASETEKRKKEPTNK